MVTLDELKQISDMTPLERSFFTDQLAHFVNGPINPDELYQSQFDLVNKFKDAGFTMTEEEPSPVIIASVNEDPRESEQREFERKYLEKKVIAAW